MIYNYLGAPKCHFDIIKDQTARYKIPKGKYFDSNIRNYPKRYIYRYPYNRIKFFEEQDFDPENYHQ